MLWAAPSGAAYAAVAKNSAPQLVSKRSTCLLLLRSLRSAFPAFTHRQYYKMDEWAIQWRFAATLCPETVVGQTESSAPPAFKRGAQNQNSDGNQSDTAGT